ncbi:MAG TPA: bifunctional glutamate N-acetyltransferase/amino-acid acetyltransferase ArgJ [Candidatus Acidoferrum sp.]|nr:bifunctional glutamate N-acetyltransferase/amino-acid acetyltransferase ArgJ [Candidatus Acidoferrum sp.]
MTATILHSDLPEGFSFASTHCGLKRKRHDLGILVSERPAAAAAVFTTNRVTAAPVRVSREHLRNSRGRMRAAIVNSGNANCCTGARGEAASRKTAVLLARELGALNASEVLVCSTGVIGVPLRVEKILRAIPGVVKARRQEASAFEQFARAIMTTDTRPKWSAARCRIGGKTIRIIGCAKGSGMIEPHMATMLAFLATDADISPSLLSRSLRDAVKRTFNAITVDGDSSTNDTVAVFANGSSGARKIASAGADFRNFSSALGEVCRELALAIVADGEGAQRVIEIEVYGAPSDEKANVVAHTIANSPLVKTAFAGGDPNWGRILAAAGRSGVVFDPDRADIKIANIEVCSRGLERHFSERVLHAKMLAKHVPVFVHLHAGNGKARVWTCDFTSEYVRINASYRT